LSFELHHAAIAEGRPRSWLLALHGILGSGSNLRTMARNVVRERPDWGVELVDLREHGRSLGAPGPHTVAAAAADVVALATRLKAEGRVVAAILGHSFGGKVAAHARARLGPELRQTWLIDSSPSARPGGLSRTQGVPQVLAMLEGMPTAFESREDFIAQVEGHGSSATLGAWLAMNLEADGAGRYRLRIDLRSIRELLTDYFADDAWPLLETREPGEVHFVVASRSDTLDGVDREYLGELASRSPTIFVHPIDTGHWVHSERPAELSAMLVEHLPRGDA